MAFTEYNAMYVQETPIPYRFTLGGALFSADYVRVLMQPQTNVMVANYWQFCNGYWGLIRGPHDPATPAEWRLMPAYYLFRLWAQHFGQTLVEADATGPRLDFEGAINTLPARGDGGLPPGLAPDANLLDKAAPLQTKGDGLTWRRNAPDSLQMDLTAVTKEQYPGIAVIRPVSPGTYRVSFEARASGDLTGGSFGLALADLRGWEVTRSAAVAGGVESATDWQAFSVDYSPPTDCAGMALMWRVVPGKAPLTGSISVRKLRITPVPGVPAYAALTAAASLSADGRTLYLIVFNKHHAQDLPVRVSLAGFPAASGKVWTVTGPSLEALNVTEDQVRETESGAPLTGLTADGFSRTFPAHSMTAIEITRAE
jgi:alpha-N-arabinofuranosidase